MELLKWLHSALDGKGIGDELDRSSCSGLFEATFSAEDNRIYVRYSIASRSH